MSVSSSAKYLLRNSHVPGPTEVTGIVLSALTQVSTDQSAPLLTLGIQRGPPDGRWKPRGSQRVCRKENVPGRRNSAKPREWGSRGRGGGEVGSSAQSAGQQGEESAGVSEGRELQPAYPEARRRVSFLTRTMFKDHFGNG